MSYFTQFEDSARARHGYVVMPEGDDIRVVRAARRLTDEGFAHVTLLGSPGTVAETAKSAGVVLDGIIVREPFRDSQLDEMVSQYAKRHNMSADDAAPLVVDPLFFGGMMVSLGTADAMVAGAVAETGKVIRAGLKTTGLAPGITRLSSFFLMAVADFMGAGPRTFLFADPAVNIDPSPEDLAGIAVASAASARNLLEDEPRVALLSFSTRGSASHPHVDKVREATAIARKLAPDVMIDGELQADAAIVAAVAERKITDGSPVAGHANVLIFPDLNAGNIAYKLVQYMGGVTAVGPFLQGFAKPICDLSRGASVDDIVNATVVTLAGT